MPEYQRYFEGGLRHVVTDAPHNDAAHSVHECDACVLWARQVMAELSTSAEPGPDC